MSKIQNLSVISFLSFSIIVGSLVFSRGFLLNRQTISEKSSPCWNSNYSKQDSNPIPPFELTVRNLSSAASWCNPSPLFPKMILILVDALRFDFVSRMKFLSKITSVKDNQVQSGISTCLFKFLADPPTTTMQRLKALMTGTMPTFIDAGANFNSYEVEEDSLIYQLYAANKKVAFLGDDTWLSLFPRKLFQSPYVEAFPSFNAWDLDTVDKGVNSSLRNILSSGNSIEEWDVIISHLLGVDHCGHRYGPNHPEMIRKLDEADAIIEYVFNAMSHDTLLVIFGDHGMTETGDHGGDSKDEIESAVIFLTKQLKRNKQINPPFQCPSKYFKRSKVMSISQVDLTPTLSSMLGVPIPFSSIGQIIPEFLVNKIFSDAVAANVAQVQKYINRYSTVSNIAHMGDHIHQQYEKVEEAFMEYQSSRNPSTRAKLHESAQDYLLLMKSIAVSTWTQFDVPMIYTGILIVVLSVVSLTVYLSNVPTLLKKRNRSSYSALSWLWPSLPVWSVLSSFVTKTNSTTGLIGIIVCTLSGIVVFLVILCVKLIKIGIFRRKHINKHKKTQSTRNTSKNSDLDISDFGSIILYAFTCLAVFSNSYVINEGYIIGSVLLTVVLIHIMSSRQPLRQLGIGIETDFHQRNEDTAIHLPIVVKLFKCSWFCFFMLACIIRVGHIFFRCREELQECREEFLLHKQLSSLPSDWLVHKYVRYGIALVALAVFVVSFQHWMLHRKCILNSRPCSIIAKFVPSLLVVLLGVFWALQGLPFASTSALRVKPLLTHFPWVFQTVTICSLIVIWIKPLCCVGRLGRRGLKKSHLDHKAIFEKKTNVKPIKPYIDSNHVNLNNLLFSTNNFSNGTIHLNGINSGQFCKENIVLPPLRKVQSQKTFSGDPSIMNREGNECSVSETTSEDIFSSSLLTFSALVLLLLVQVTSSGITPAVTMIAYAIVCLVGIYRSSPSHDLSSWSAVISWVLCSQYFFYATGHQPIFSALPWDSVFIGSMDGNNLGTSPDSWLTWLRPALAVLGNLHVSQILFSLSLPLLAYWKGDSDASEIKFGHQERRKAYIIGGKFVVLHAFKLLLCMTCAAWQRRHLMVWKIFAPKFIFEAVSFIVTSSLITFSLVFLSRVDYLYQKLVNRYCKESHSRLLPFHSQQSKS